MSFAVAPTKHVTLGPVSSSATRSPRVRALVSAYYELVTEAASDEVTRELSIASASLADVETLLGLCRAVRDPFAWQPFLRRLDTIPTSHRTARSDASRHRLHTLATDLLREQGLGLLRPEDLLARPTPFEEALNSLSTNRI